MTEKLIKYMDKLTEAIENTHIIMDKTLKAYQGMAHELTILEAKRNVLIEIMKDEQNEKIDEALKESGCGTQPTKEASK